MKTKRFISILLLLLAAVFGFGELAEKDSGKHYVQDAPILDSKKLDANTISTWHSNNGQFNADPFQNNPGFEWPRGSGLHARYASGLWISGTVGNDTFVTVAQYSSEYAPGYISNNCIPTGENDPLYRVFKLIKGVNNQDRAEWPNALLGNSNQGAPVYFDSSSNMWKPLDFGTQTMFYAYTDGYPQYHTLQTGGTPPLNVEVKQLNFAVDTTAPLSNVTITQFTVINRCSNVINNAYFTIWTDDDLGEPNDDKVGCDSATGLGYTYNGDNDDEGYYGPNPPAVGFLMLRGAYLYTANNNDTVYFCRNKSRTYRTGYRDLGMAVFNQYYNFSDPQQGEPYSYTESYRYISGFMRDGTPIYNPVGFVTKYKFSGDPVTYTGWVQFLQSDQRFMMSSGPLTFSPGDTEVIVAAQIIARGTSNLNSITVLRQYAASVRGYYNTCYTGLPPIGIINLNEQAHEFRLEQNYPNPFNTSSKFKFQISKLSEVIVSVYDALGREIRILMKEHLMPGTYETGFDGTDLPSGVYFYRLNAVPDGGQLEGFSETKKMVLLK